MTSVKAISFKPTLTDQQLIDCLRDLKKLNTNADIIRAAINHYALSALPADAYQSIVVNAYKSQNIL